ncbi:MAG: hypothetical protein PHY90_09365, partial [Desulfitobacteriaceae bacterium]|nr:hypothetical protein [Desulfitobacteriaceae bacterium]
GAAYQTLLLLNRYYTKEYKTLQFGSTNTAIRYFEEELARVGKELKEGEDSLTLYNIENRIINYDEQTKQVAALDKDYDLRFQDLLLNYNSAAASVRFLETHMEENMLRLKDNADFLAKLNQISFLDSKIAEIETFYHDSVYSVQGGQDLKTLKQQSEKVKNDLVNYTESYSNRKYTRDGYPTSNFVTQWVDELLKLERAKAEIEVMEDDMARLDQQYSHFSPIGSTIKRQERSINFTERNYLSILTSLNAARLRLKSLEMNSASLKLINQPVFPLNAEPSTRRKLVMAAYAGSLFFLIGFFLLVDLLDRTLRDRIRTERVTGAKVLGALPGKGKLRQRKYSKLYKEKAVQYIANALQDHFHEGDSTPIINIISSKAGMGKSFLVEMLNDYWTKQGITVQLIRYGEDFDPASPEYIFSGSIRDLVRNEMSVGKKIILVEHASMEVGSIPASLLSEASVNLAVLRADRVWSEKNKQLFDRFKTKSATTPTFVCLNFADKDVVECFTGMLPPYSTSRRLFYSFTQFGLTASCKSNV